MTSLTHALRQSRDIDLVVKLGGALITDKSRTRCLREAVLERISTQIARVARAGVSMVLVHGAGSFGHHTASAAGVQHGVAAGAATLAEDARTMQGFVDTRAAVVVLNGLVVAALLKAGLPAVGLSPFPSWRCAGGGRHVEADSLSCVGECVRQGLLPVLHGDAVLDSKRASTILSGDVVVSCAAGTRSSITRTAPQLGAIGGRTFTVPTPACDICLSRYESCAAFFERGAASWSQTSRECTTAPPADLTRSWCPASMST